jgi:hypothetical protein
MYTDNDYYKSTDEGISWISLIRVNYGRPLATNNFGDIFTVGLNGSVIRSSDDGGTWNPVSDKISSYEELDLQSFLIFHPKSSTGLMGVSFYNMNNRITTDNGMTWNDPMFNVYLDESIFIDSAYHYCFFDNIWVIRCDANFRNWDTLINAGIKNRFLNIAIAGPDGHYYAFSQWGGIYRTIDNFVSVPNPHILNSNLSLSVYPNPVSSEAEIVYTLPDSGLAKIKLYNSLGICVATLFDGYCDLGINKCNIKMEDMTPGIYFINLIAGDKIITEKIAVISL